MALDVDGSSFGNPGRAGYGGLIRDHTGSWIIGFSGNIGFADNVKAELGGIMMGLTLAWDLGYRDVSCRSDCVKAISLVQDSTSQPHTYVEIIDNIKELMSRDWIVSLVHTYKEGNQCANFMAEMGAMGANDGMAMLFPDQPSPDHHLSSLLSSDAKRTLYVRV